MEGRCFLSGFFLMHTLQLKHVLQSRVRAEPYPPGCAKIKGTVGYRTGDNQNISM